MPRTKNTPRKGGERKKTEDMTEEEKAQREKAQWRKNLKKWHEEEEARRQEKLKKWNENRARADVFFTNNVESLQPFFDANKSYEDRAQKRVIELHPSNFYYEKKHVVFVVLWHDELESLLPRLCDEIFPSSPHKWCQVFQNESATVYALFSIKHFDNESDSNDMKND